ncbi:MAG: TonB-dependent receptor [Sphingobium sp.]
MALKNHLMLSVAISAVFPVGSALAQSDAPAQGAQTANTAQLEDIIVTAQRTNQRLQDVPIAVNAVGATALEDRGIASAFSLGQAVPGLQIVQTGTATTPYLRGIGSNAANPNSEASVATYVDGIYIGAPFGSVFAFNNIDRIEVLKGPQGTLFGRNATGGVIQVITKTPSHETGMEFNVGYANYETVNANAYVTTGLGQNVAMDLSVLYKNQNEGFGRNMVTGTETYKSREFGARSKILWEPSDRATITLAGDYAYVRANDLNYVFAEGVAGSDGIVRDHDYYNTAANTDDLRIAKAWGGSLDIRYDLGFATLASISARRITKGLNRFDSDATPLPIVAFNTPQRVATWSQEVQLLSNADSPFDWALGAFYFDNKAAYDPARLVGIAFGPNPDSEMDIYGQQHSKSFSVYGQATVEVLPALKLTGGLRYTDERQTAEWAVGAPGSPLGAVPSRKAGFKEFTWRAAIDYEVVDNIHLYTSYNRGLKSGGFDLLSPGADPFNPEFLDAYEAGIKSQFFNNRVRINVSGFYYDYKDIQVSVNPRGSIVTLNAAEATVKGIDADFEVAVTRQFRLSGGLGFTNAKFGNFPNPIIYPPSPLDPPVTLANADGNRLTRTPKFTGNVGGTYSIESDIGTFDLTGSYYHNSGYFWDVDNRHGVDAYDLVGASITWKALDEGLRIRLWVENLTDKHYAYQGVSSANGDVEVYAAPRTYGITVGSKF